jgi:hypothetical protein
MTPAIAGHRPLETKGGVRTIDRGAEIPRCEIAARHLHVPPSAILIPILTPIAVAQRAIDSMAERTALRYANSIEAAQANAVRTCKQPIP